MMRGGKSCSIKRTELTSLIAFFLYTEVTQYPNKFSSNCGVLLALSFNFKVMVLDPQPFDQHPFEEFF